MSASVFYMIKYTLLSVPFASPFIYNCFLYDWKPTVKKKYKITILLTTQNHSGMLSIFQCLLFYLCMICTLVWVFPKEGSKTTIWVQIVWDEHGTPADSGMIRAWETTKKKIYYLKSSSLVGNWNQSLGKLWEMVQSTGFNDPIEVPEAWLGMLGVDVKLSVLVDHC